MRPDWKAPNVSHETTNWRKRSQADRRTKRFCQPSVKRWCKSQLRNGLHPTNCGIRCISHKLAARRSHRQFDSNTALPEIRPVIKNGQIFTANSSEWPPQESLVMAGAIIRVNVDAPTIVCIGTTHRVQASYASLRCLSRLRRDAKTKSARSDPTDLSPGQ